MENLVFRLIANELRLKNRVPVRIGVPPPIFWSDVRIGYGASLENWWG